MDIDDHLKKFEASRYFRYFGAFYISSNEVSLEDVGCKVWGGPLGCQGRYQDEGKGKVSQRGKC